MHVDHFVWCGLGAIDQTQGAGVVRDPGDLPDRVHHPERIGHVGDADELRALADQTPVVLHAQAAVIGHVHVAEHDTASSRQQLPGDDVRVVLHDRKHDLVALRELRAPAGRDEVDRLGGSAREDQLGGIGRADVAGNRAAGRLVRFGGPIPQLVGAPMHVGVIACVKAANGFDNRARLLARSTIVDVDQRLPVNFLL